MFKERPQSSVDLFSLESLNNPFPLYQELRALGGAVWMSAIGYMVLSRYDDVRDALRNWRLFSSAQGVALNDAANKALMGGTLASDNPLHAMLRKIVAKPLGLEAVTRLSAQIEDEAEGLADRLFERGTFDAVEDLAWYLPLTIVSRFVGLPEEGRLQMLRWSQANGNLVGPDHAGADQPYRDRVIASLPTIASMRNYVVTEATRTKLTPGSWGAMLFEAADKGEIPENMVPSLLRDYLGPALETTISATGSMMWLFANNPDQWARLRAEPSLAHSAVLESVRLEAPIQWFARVLAEDHEVDGVLLKKGERVILSLGSANRDEQKYADPEKFDIGRNASDQVGWGHGVHFCVGVHLAQLEMRSILKAVSRRAARIELAGEPERSFNNAFRSFAHIPLSIS